jgi:signal peptidase I
MPEKKRYSPTPQSPPPETIQENPWIEGFKTIGLSLFLAFGIRTFVAEARYIPSGSMLPTLQINDRLFVDKVSYHLRSPQRGDIIVFNPTDTLLAENFHDAFIKRIVALPGETVEIKGGQVYINGQSLPESYLPQGQQTTLDGACGPGAPAFLNGPTQVPANSYLTLGDNRENSLDGRCWGFVPRDRIIGRAVFRFWPVDHVGPLSEALQLGLPLRFVG